MRTSTSAEETLKAQSNRYEWSQTSGAAAPWQLYASSNVAFVAAPDVGTIPVDLMFPITVGLDALTFVQETQLEEQPEKEQLPLFGPENALPNALMNLLAYSPVPDEPNDEDVRPELGYEFPE